MAEEAEANNCPIPGYASVDAFAQNAFTTILSALKAGNGLPRNGDDFDYYSSFDGFREFCHQNGERILRIIQQIIGNQTMTNALAKSSLSLDLEEKMEALIDANDSMLERVGILLDEATGVKKKPALVIPASAPAASEVSIASWNKKDKNTSARKGSFHMMYAKNTTRPQLKFKQKVDNSNVPFKPIIKHKPNALKPLETDFESSSQSVQEFIAQQRQEVETGIPAMSAPHPYQFEIETFEPEEWQLSVDESCQYLPVQLTPLTMITENEDLQNLSKLLKKQKQFAVDLEHHSYRSFQGFTCLMQISTADHDYLIDTLELRSELHILNESFTDPKIVKVFHGAVMDIEWLQRDFGLYVVNLFDTGEASRVLGLARNSLEYLLKHYCKVETDKKYQLADWRIRPIPDEMKLYAREDTHYLLYIYNKMKEELINLGNEQKNLLKSVFHRSKEVALRKYNKPLFTSVSYLVLYKKNRKQFNAKQIHAFKLLYAWRDSVAREEDESTGYILPNHMLFQISEHLPRETSGILACCNPVPPSVMQNLADVHRIIVQARNYKGEPEISVKKVTESAKAPVEEVTFSSRVIDVLESILHCPHDLSQTDHPTLQPIEPLLHQQSTKPTMQMAEPRVHILGIVPVVEESIKISSKADKVDRIKTSLYNPFQMYLPTKTKSTTISEKPSQVAPGLLNADKITLGDVSSPARNVINSPYVWKMKQSPKPAVPPQDDARKSEEIHPKKTEKSSKSKKSPQEKEAVPLREMKRKASREESHTSKESNPSKKTKKELADQIPDFSRVNQPQFQPYNYSQNQHVRFDDKPSSPVDPLPRNPGKRHLKRLAPISNVHPQSGQKSMSFSQSERSRGSKGRQHWPK